jgi:hypothetical protein
LEGIFPTVWYKQKSVLMEVVLLNSMIRRTVLKKY